MMVAPLFAGEPSRKIVIPDGGWHDFWTGEAIKGCTDLTVDASTKKIPVFVKRNSLVPWAETGLFGDAPEARRITVRVYGDGSRDFALRDHIGTLLFRWENGRGVSEGASGYDVIAWKQMGSTR